MATLTVKVTPGYDFADAEVLTPAIVRAIAAPQVDMEGTVSAAALADASVTEAKLATSVAGNGLTGGAGNPLSVVTDNATMEFAAGTVHVKDNGIAAAKLQQDAFAYAAAVQTGTTNVYLAALTPAPAAYVTGMAVRLKMDTVNTGAVTINLNSLGAKSLCKNTSQVLAGGDIQPGMIIEAFYDGAVFQIESMRTVNQGVIGASRNLVSFNNAGTPNSKIDLTADEVVLKRTDGSPYLATAVNLTLDMGGTVSSPLGLDTGSEAASTWYYIWLIYNGTAVSAVFSTSRTAPTLGGALAAYTYMALVGVVRNNAGSNFVSYYQTGRDVVFAAQNIFNGKQVNTNALLVAASADLTAFQAAVPPNAVRVSGTIGSATTKIALLQVSTDATGLGGQVVNAAIGADGGFGYGAAAPFSIPIKNQNIAIASDNAAGRCRMDISGFTL